MSQTERNLKLTLSYDGTNYHGWQIQSGQNSIQAVLQQAFQQIVKQKLNVQGSGRTDAGVHAVGQVANVKLHSELECAKLLRSLNGILPADIVVQSIEQVDLAFHAQKSAISKKYRYVIYNKPFSDPLFLKRAWHIPQPLDWEQMAAAGETLLGSHDFSSFRASGSSVKSSKRNIQSLEICMLYSGYYLIDITANGFLKQMVRNIIGTLVDVGRKKRSPQEFKTILVAKDRSQAGECAPAHGLYLLQVDYPD